MTDELHDQCLKRFVLIESDVREVWAALSEPRRLEAWLCDSAQVELKPGGRFDFRGKTVFEGGGGQRLLHVVRERRLEFEWMLCGHLTRVTLRLDPQLDLTRVEVSHFHPADISKYLLDDIWKYCLTLLKFHLEEGSTPQRIDFSQLPKEKIDLSIEVPHPPRQVYEAVTKSQSVADWLEVNARIDLRLGGLYETDYWEGCIIRSLEPGRSVAFVHPNGSRIEWVVEAAGKGARLRLVHSGFADEEELRCLFYGWAAFLVVIAMYLRKQSPAKSWGAMV